jgi:hypothetical protein
MIDLSDFLDVQRRTVQASFCAKIGPLLHVISPSREGVPGGAYGSKGHGEGIVQFANAG